MNGLINWFARTKAVSNLLMAGILAGGIWSAFTQVGSEVFPSVDINYVQVSAVWPGASPKDVEQQITSRMEDAFEGAEGVDRIFSASSEGISRVYVEFGPRENMIDATARIRGLADGVPNLPQDMRPIRVEQLKQRQNLVRFAVHGWVSERELIHAAEDVRRQLAQLPNVPQVAIWGFRPEEVAIEVSDTALRSYGLTLDDVASAVRRSSLNLTAGSVKAQSGTIQIRADNLADAEADFEQIIVRQSSEGGEVRVGDIATVIDGYEENPLLATLEGEPAVLVQVMSEGVKDVLRTSKTVKAWYDKK